MALLYVVLLSVCLEVVLTAALPVSSQNSTCQFQGHTVHGDFIQGPCMFCHCSNGQASCALRDCAPRSCRFQTRQPDECCSSCATGNNVLFLVLTASAMAQVSLCICADSPEPLLLDYTKYGCK